jgi:signal transduction histidine kinase/ligand-binding sensor domain-containing protein
MWLATDRGLVRYRDGQFHEYGAAEGRPEGGTNGMFVDSTGAVWIATEVGGVARFANGRFESYSDRGLGSGFAGSVLGDGQGNIWVDRGGPNLFVLRPGAQRFVSFPLSGPGIRAGDPQTRDSKGNVWFATNKGPARWTGTALEPFGMGGSSLVEDGTGGWWALGGGGIWHQDAKGAREFVTTPNEQMLGDFTGTVLVDREHTLWIGTVTRGLLRVRPRLFQMYFAADGVKGEAVTAVMRDGRGGLWLGSSCGPTSVLDKQPARPSLPGCVFSLANAPDGAVWAGSYGGLARIPADGPIEYFGGRRGVRDGLEVLSLRVDPDSSLWIGTVKDGLLHLGAGDARVYTTQDGLPSNAVVFTVRDHRGTMWVGTQGGLARMDGDRFKAWTRADGLPQNYVRAVYEDRDGIYWIGTYGGGLARFDGRQFNTVGMKDGLFDNVVSSIAEDSAGNLWMSGNRGIFRASRKSLNDFVLGRQARVASVGYGPSDGLLTPETNGGFQPAVWQDRDGRLWFPTVHGLTTVDPKDALRSESRPNIVVEAVRVDGRATTREAAARLPVGTRSVEIEYAGLTSIAPEQVSFRYRLDGIDRDWTYVGDRRTAYFTGLATGPYRFLVEAASRDGVWSERAPPLDFRLPPPWYATWWFRLIAVLALAGGATAFIRQRFARVEVRAALQREFSRQLIAGQEQERSRIAGELHDSLGQDLLVMKNRAVIALRTPGIDSAVREHIEEISAVATAAVQNAREISHGLRPHQLDVLGLPAAVRDLASHASAAGSLEVHVDIPDDEKLVDADASIHLFRIVQEALNNILKHAEATRVTIAMRREGAGVLLEVSDDGRGADLSRGAGFGLSGIGQRIQLLGGTLAVRSAPGAGTTLDIFVPAARE